jgi:cytochrome c-type biogenesis protein CcmE
VFFFSPSDVAADKPAVGRVVRLGGLVEAGSVERSGDGSTIHFKVTDLKNTVAITFRGVLPDLFRESQGVVVEGAYGDDGEFTATEVLAKHDEKYMPPEVAKALKESGRWQEGATAEPASPGSDTQPAATSGTGTTSGTNP